MEEENEEVKSFKDLGLRDELVEACNSLGWKNLSKIQAEAILHALEGKDLIGLAQGSEDQVGGTCSNTILPDGSRITLNSQHSVMGVQLNEQLYSGDDLAPKVQGLRMRKSLLMSQMSLEKRFGQSAVFVASTLMENGGVPQSATPETLLKEAIHVISCGYEDKTDWGSEIGWIYGSVTEDILTGFKMHARGWRSIYCMPQPPAFKGSAPINLSDRLNQVLRWALGSVEILLNRHCPIWYGYSGRLKWLERFAYVNTTIYPITSIPLLAYCTLGMGK